MVTESSGARMKNAWKAPPAGSRSDPTSTHRRMACAASGKVTENGVTSGGAPNAGEPPAGRL